VCGIVEWLLLCCSWLRTDKNKMDGWIDREMDVVLWLAAGCAATPSLCTAVLHLVVLTDKQCACLCASCLWYCAATWSYLFELARWNLVLSLVGHRFVLLCNTLCLLPNTCDINMTLAVIYWFLFLLVWSFGFI
jgi:hypothetical protein